ncbi:hypothetical protein MUO14_21110 [Halobacillus shinanisalinarum]|uniref:Uncharacterized protein n=1 Tax=Halobacillus shinanisalinarum TaxID=2932258 RepID=A0ABY4GXH0_9BACI|nr:hypothetical protein [Halobacillus shinanisalinarum]UOQ92875.1 hypothetical protein MUO14_21110 [Halobacillus shinanisalinarum]
MHNNNVHGMQYENQMHPGVQGAYQDGDIKEKCKKYMQYHVMGQMTDGSHVEGIITNMDENNVEMLVPEEVDGSKVNRQFGYWNDYNDYDDYDYDDGYNGYRRYRRYRRRRFPYRFFRRLFRYPYYYPYYY